MRALSFIVLLMGLGACGKAPVNGTNGTNGVNGIDAAPVTVVQLCSACVPVYPSTFAEVAFCIQGNLYAVYSANGGFESEITPGAYSSDGINCSCNFTVSANCNVVQN